MLYKDIDCNFISIELMNQNPIQKLQCQYIFKDRHAGIAGEITKALQINHQI